MSTRACVNRQQDFTCPESPGAADREVGTDLKRVSSLEGLPKHEEQQGRRKKLPGMGMVLPE